MNTLAFLQRHFADLREGELIEIRCVFKDDSKPAVRKYFTDPAQAADFALRGNAAGYHAFYGVNPRSQAAIDAGHRGKDAVARVTHLWVDLDCKGDTRALEAAAGRLADFSPPYDILVNSGGGYQAIWRLHETAHGHATIETALGYLASDLSGDPAVAEIARVLRLPETVNWKPEYPTGTVAWVVDTHDTVHGLSAFLRVRPALTPPPPSTPSVSSSSDIDAAEFWDALAAIDPWALSYDEWLRCLMAIHAFAPGYEGLVYAETWGQGKKGEIATKWRSFKKDGSNPSTIFYFARQAGWRPDRPAQHTDFPGFPGPAGDDQPAPKKHTIAVTRLADFFAEVDTPPTWVVDDFLHAGGISLLVAKPKTGKSTFCANLAVAVGSGTPFLGHATTKGAVQIYSMEVGRAFVREQYRQLVAAYGLPEPPDVAIHTSTGAMPDALEQIAAIVRETRPALVVIDTLAKAVPIADGNNYHEVYQAMMPLMALAEEAGCHIVCVHHTNKGLAEGADAVMGSVAFAASVDLTIVLKRDREANLRTMELEARFLPEQDPVAFDFDEDRRIVALGDRDDLLKRTAEARILAAIAGNPGLTQSELAAATGLPPAHLGPTLFRLAQVMRIKADGSPKRYTLFAYAPEAGVPAPAQGGF